MRRQAKLIERRELGGFLDAALDGVLFFERAGLGSDEAEHNDLVAFRQKPQRLKAAGASGSRAPKSAPKR